MFSINFSLPLIHSDKTGRKGAKRVALFLDDSLSLINSLTGVKRPSTLKNYRTALRSFRHFIDETAEKTITAELLKQYEGWLLSSGIKRNTSSCYLRSLRALYQQLYGEAQQLFHGVFTYNEKTEKRSMSVSLVQQLTNARPDVPKRYQFCYDMFLFSVYAFGMPFIDLANLSRSNIVGSTIIYHRHKTGQMITVPIIPEMMLTIDKYSGKANGGLLFPILPSADCSYKTYQSCLSEYNRDLKHLAAVAGLDVRLTSYVARHTWATLATKSGINVHHISQAMGHTSLRTTEIYLGQLSTSELHEDSLLITRLMKKI